MDQFSSNELTTMEKTVNTRGPPNGKPKDIETYYELGAIVDFVRSNQFKTVCLQFPDHLLNDSYEVTSYLKQVLNDTVYVMADSNYESCCVDYLTAQHVNADAIIHFGPRCHSLWTETIPCLCIYEKEILDVNLFIEKVQDEFSQLKPIFLKIDTPYLHLKEEIYENLKQVGFHLVDNPLPDGLTINIYLGEDNRNLLNFQLTERIDPLHHYDPTTSNPTVKPYNLNKLLLKRRNFLIEKIKDSQRVGIVIGTLVIKNFLKAVDRVKTLLKLHGKKYYVLSVGRPTVAKLANFPEMDVYVLVCCPSSAVFESRDFHKPIVALHDVEAALNPTENGRFTYGIDEELLEREIKVEGVGEPDVSLISGGVRWRDDVKNETSDVTAVAVKSEGTVTVKGLLAERTFVGLEQRLGETEVTLAEEGRKGIAQNYENELF